MNGVCTGLLCPLKEPNQTWWDCLIVLGNLFSALTSIWEEMHIFQQLIDLAVILKNTTVSLVQRRKRLQ